MKRFMQAFIVIFTMLAVAAAITGPQAAQKDKQTKEQDKIVMEIGPTIDMGGGLLYYPLGSKPVAFDKSDVGKSFNKIKNPDTRAQLEQIAAEMYVSVGNVENARLIAESAASKMIFLADFTDEHKQRARQRAANGFVADFEEMAANNFSLTTRDVMYTEAPPAGDCAFLDICPGVCGTKLSGYCFTNYPCLDCGKTPK